jgi:hypothetical protein
MNLVIIFPLPAGIEAQKKSSGRRGLGGVTRLRCEKRPLTKRKNMTKICLVSARAWNLPARTKFNFIVKQLQDKHTKTASCGNSSAKHRNYFHHQQALEHEFNLIIPL